MRHFTKDELIDALEGALSSAQTEHLAACASCRDQLETLRDALARTKDVEVPEPSPLFWEHFSSNVREAIREPVPQSIGGGWFRRPAALWTLAAAVTTVVMAVAVIHRLPSSTVSGTKPAIKAIETSTTSQAGGARTPTSHVDDMDADEGWAFVRSVADEVTWDQANAAGLNTQPDSVERIAAEMSARERRELARLVEDELRKGA